jgi:hypothetical protein
MRVEIIDNNVFNSIEPEAITRYLLANGWSEVRRVDGEMIVFGKTGRHGKKPLLWMPISNDLSDYAPMVAQLIRTVAKEVDKSEIQIMDDLETVAIGDIIRVRSFDPLDLNDHTIPLSDGVNLLNRARAMALAGASSAIEHRPVQSRRPNTEAKQFVRNLRLGQTERGSFLLRLISPIIDIKSGEYLEFQGMDRLPFSRRAIMELVKGLNALRDAAKENEERGRFFFNSFLELVPSGVSANLCEAIVDIDEKESLSRPIEVSVTWSYAVTSPDHLPINPISFEPNIVPYIRQAAKEFRAQNPEVVTIKGWINILERESRSGPGGLVRIHSRIDGRPRSVRANLDTKSYNEAIEAHKRGEVIAVTGTLIVDGSVYRLQNPSGFHIMGQMDLFEQEYEDDVE